MKKDKTIELTANELYEEASKILPPRQQPYSRSELEKAVMAEVPVSCECFSWGKKRKCDEKTGVPKECPMIIRRTHIDQRYLKNYNEIPDNIC